MTTAISSSTFGVKTVILLHFNVCKVLARTKTYNFAEHQFLWKLLFGPGKSSQRKEPHWTRLVLGSNFLENSKSSYALLDNTSDFWAISLLVRPELIRLCHSFVSRRSPGGQVLRATMTSGQRCPLTKKIRQQKMSIEIRLMCDQIQTLLSPRRLTLGQPSGT